MPRHTYDIESCWPGHDPMWRFEQVHTRREAEERIDEIADDQKAEGLRVDVSYSKDKR